MFEKNVEPRRAALWLIYNIVSGVGVSALEKEARVEIFKMLKVVDGNVAEDDIVRGHAQTTISLIHDEMFQSSV